MKAGIENYNDIVAQYGANVYIRPDLRLVPYIAHYTISLVHSPTTSFLTLVPDVSGCLVMPDILHEFTCSYWGPTTKTVIVEAEHASENMMLFVEFRPGGAYSFFHFPLREVCDLQINLKDIFPSLYQKMLEAYESSEDIPSFIDKLNTLFLSILTDNPQQHLLYMLEKIQKSEGKLSMRDLENTSGYSKRHLQRIFQEQLGTSMRMMTRIQRINHALELIQKQNRTLTEIAMLCGYYDQSHFNHDFKQVVQLSPTQYLSKMSFYYKEPFKF